MVLYGFWSMVEGYLHYQIVGLKLYLDNVFNESYHDEIKAWIFLIFNPFVLDLNLMLILDLMTKLTSNINVPTRLICSFTSTKYKYFTDLLSFGGFLVVMLISLFQVFLSHELISIVFSHLWILVLSKSKHLSYQAFSF